MEFNEKSDKKFPAALDDLLNEHGWSNRHVAHLTREKFAWGSHGTINFLMNGELDPSRNAMELIADVCGVHPSFFAEYRLLKARDQLDPNEVGFRAALANLKAMS